MRFCKTFFRTPVAQRQACWLSKARSLVRIQLGVYFFLLLFDFFLTSLFSQSYLSRKHKNYSSLGMLLGAFFSSFVLILKIASIYWLSQNFSANKFGWHFSQDRSFEFRPSTRVHVSISIVRGIFCFQITLEIKNWNTSLMWLRLSTESHDLLRWICFAKLFCLGGEREAT